MIKPITEPVVAALLPPNFFVINEGRKLSITETKTAKMPEITRPKIEMSQYDEKNARRSPIHASGAPGRTGTNVPINPTASKIPAKIAKTRLKFMQIFYYKAKKMYIL